MKRLVSFVCAVLLLGGVLTGCAGAPQWATDLDLVAAGVAALDKAVPSTAPAATALQISQYAQQVAAGRPGAFASTSLAPGSSSATSVIATARAAQAAATLAEPLFASGSPFVNVAAAVNALAPAVLVAAGVTPSPAAPPGLTAVDARAILQPYTGLAAGNNAPGLLSGIRSNL